MMNYELAIDEDGEPFGVPPQVAGWRVRRAADGRGRPALMHGRGSEKGKPLVLRANASHAELLAAAGPGKYRLEAVDEHWHKVDGVPVACTGPLSADEEDPSEDDASAEPVGSSGGSGSRQIEDVLCQVVNANTRMVEKALGQIGTVMSGVAELLNAAHNAGITSRVPPPLPPPPPPPPPVDSHEDEEDEEDEDEEAAPTSGIPEFVRLLIKEAVDKVVPLIFEKLTSGGGLGGLPLEALLDWRKAAPSPAAAPSAPAAATTPSVPTAPAAPNAPTASGGPTPSAPANWPAAPAAPSAPAASSGPTSSAPASWPAGAAAASYAVTSPPPPSAPAPTGAAPSRESPPGTAPATPPATPVASSPRTQEDAAATINAHVMQIWQGLSPPERARAGQLIARLTAEERTAWLGELARLTVPEAITRARAVIHAQTPQKPQLPTTTPQGDPS
jgi:hypothetical protein